MRRKIIHTSEAPQPIGPYSQAVQAGGEFIYTAGQIPLDPKTGQIVEGGIKEQTRQVLQNLRAILEQAGASLNTVIKTTIYLKDLNEFSSVNEVYAEFFQNDPPARTTIEVSRLPRDVRIEIDAVAIIEKSEKN